MSCTKTLTLAVASPPMPLDDAVYYSGKIYGVSGPYVHKFDASTGALEDSAVIARPLLGPTRITVRGATLYVAAFNCPVSPDFKASGTESGKGYYAVNSTTLAAGAIEDVTALWSFGSSCPLMDGPTAIMCDGTYLYFNIYTNTSVQTVRVDPTNTADKTTLTAIPDATYSRCENFDLDTSGSMIMIPLADRVEYSTLAGASDDYTDNGASKNMTGCAWSPGNSRIYAVGDDATLYKLERGGAYAVSSYNLAALQAGAKPFRIKYNSHDALLYIPIQNKDAVIVWNPASDTGTLKTGFDCPIDVVFTPTKKWAVQNGIAPLKEIT